MDKQAYDFGVRCAMVDAGLISRDDLFEKDAVGKGQKLTPGSLKGGKSEPSSKAKAGEGGRSRALEAKLSKKPGVRNPGGLMAAIGRAKFGKGRFQHMAAAGK